MIEFLDSSLTGSNRHANVNDISFTGTKFIVLALTGTT